MVLWIRFSLTAEYSVSPSSTVSASAQILSRKRLQPLTELEAQEAGFSKSPMNMI